MVRVHRHWHNHCSRVAGHQQQHIEQIVRGWPKILIHMCGCNGPGSHGPKLVSIQTSTWTSLQVTKTQSSTRYEDCIQQWECGDMLNCRCLLPSLMMNLKIEQQGVQTLHLKSYFNKPRRSESDNSLSFPSPSVSRSSQVSVPRTATSKIFNSCRATTKYTASLFAFTKHNHIQCWWSASTNNGNQRYIG